MKLEFNGINRFLVFGGDTVLLENMNATKRNTETLLDASKEVDLELHTDKNKYNFKSAARVLEDTIIPVIYICLITHSRILQKFRDYEKQ
jgi:hypothetical protein